MCFSPRKDDLLFEEVNKNTAQHLFVLSSEMYLNWLDSSCVLIFLAASGND